MITWARLTPLLFYRKKTIALVWHSCFARGKKEASRFLYFIWLPVYIPKIMISSQEDQLSFFLAGICFKHAIPLSLWLLVRKKIVLQCHLLVQILLCLYLGQNRSLIFSHITWYPYITMKDRINFLPKCFNLIYSSGGKKITCFPHYVLEALVG